MGKMVDVQLGEYRPVHQFVLNDIVCNRGDYVILEVDRGSEFGQVVSDMSLECKGKSESAQGRVLRVATEGDLKQIENNRMKAQDALNVCASKITERKLPMQLVKGEYTFDS